MWIPMTSERALSRLIGLAPLLALALASAWPSTARAQPSFEATVRDALAEFEAGRWVEARTLFLQAHAIRPSAEALRMAGNASYEAREYVLAVELLEQAIAEREHPLREDRAALARDALEAANRFVGRLSIVAPAGARVLVDGVERDASAPLLLPRAEHELEVSAVGFATHRELVTLDGETRTVNVLLRPAASQPLQMAPAPASEPAADSEPAWVWVLVAVAAAGLVAGVIGIGFAVGGSDAPFDANAPARVVRALEVRP